MRTCMHSIIYACIHAFNYTCMHLPNQISLQRIKPPRKISCKIWPFPFSNSLILIYYSLFLFSFSSFFFQFHSLRFYLQLRNSQILLAICLHLEAMNGIKSTSLKMMVTSLVSICYGYLPPSFSTGPTQCCHSQNLIIYFQVKCKLQ
jgi:hypothetical protein